MAVPSQPPFWRLESNGGFKVEFSR